MLHILTPTTSSGRSGGEASRITSACRTGVEIDDDLTLLRTFIAWAFGWLEPTTTSATLFGGHAWRPRRRTDSAWPGCVAQLTIGILVDLAHDQPRHRREAIELRLAPASSPRQRRALAHPGTTRRGAPGAGRPGRRPGVTAYGALSRDEGRCPSAYDDLVDDVETSASIGIDHVGIGSDFFRASQDPLRRASPAATRPRRACTHRLRWYTSRASSGSTDSAAHRGAGAAPISTRNVSTDLGGNFLRVFRQACRSPTDTTSAPLKPATRLSAMSGFVLVWPLDEPHRS